MAVQAAHEIPAIADGRLSRSVGIYYVPLAVERVERNNSEDRSEAVTGESESFNAPFGQLTPRNEHIR